MRAWDARAVRVQSSWCMASRGGRWLMGPWVGEGGAGREGGYAHDTMSPIFYLTS